MKRLMTGAVLVVLAISLVACQSSAENDAHQTVDDAIHEIEHVIAEFYLLGSSASTENVGAVIDELEVPWSALSEAAEDDEELDVSAATAAYEELLESRQALSEGQDANASQELHQKMEAFESAIDELHGAGDFH